MIRLLDHIAKGMQMSGPVKVTIWNNGIQQGECHYFDTAAEAVDWCRVNKPMGCVGLSGGTPVQVPEKPPRLVILESPYASNNRNNVAAHVLYARRCVADSLARGEAPLASHLLYTQPGVLDDTKVDERQKGVAAGLAWVPFAEASVVYTDFGISNGMKLGIDAAICAGIKVEMRSLGENSNG